MCVCLCIHAYIHMFLSVCMHMYVSSCVCMQMYVSVCAYICIYGFLCVYMYVSDCMHAHVCICVYMHMYTCFSLLCVCVFVCSRLVYAGACAHILRPRSTLKIISQMQSTLFTLASSSPSWVARRCRKYLFLPPQCWVNTTPKYIIWILGIKLRFSFLQRKHLTNRANSLAQIVEI